MRPRLFPSLSVYCMQMRVDSKVYADVRMSALSANHMHLVLNLLPAVAVRVPALNMFAKLACNQWKEEQSTSLDFCNITCTSPHR